MKQIAIDYINTYNLIGLKAGTTRETFIEIWMVVVNDRIFARSWGFAEKSWYTAFLLEPFGQLKCGDVLFRIKAKIPEDLNAVTAAINEAYLKKYNHGANIPYAEGIIKQQHIDKTMEFELCEDVPCIT